MEEKIYGALEPLGLTTKNTLFADCMCPDEINHNSKDDPSALFNKRWGEMFPLAGLAGFPFCGKTGWGAFSSHIPKDGNIIVLCAPHIGIDKHGNVGTIARHGVDHTTSACGAAIRALAAIKSDKTEGNFKNGYLDH